MAFGRKRGRIREISVFRFHQTATTTGGSTNCTITKEKRLLQQQSSSSSSIPKGAVFLLPSGVVVLVIVENLEPEEEERKEKKQKQSLSLDPHRNPHHPHHPHHLHYFQQLQNSVPNVDDDAAADDPDTDIQQDHHTHHHQPNFLLNPTPQQQQQHQSPFFYGARLVDPPPPQNPHPQHPPKKRSYISQASAAAEEYERKMGEAAAHQGAVSVAVAAPSRLGVRGGGGGGGGEIVEVQGGHIVRSTGRKDRHSKVCTAKGTRDRRVRLSAHTAIQFYDVQDRLGYDRPSKAVDWLIKKAKAAIDQLAELPAWKPTAVTAVAGSSRGQEPKQQNVEEQESQGQDQMNLHHGRVDAAKMMSSGGGGGIASISVSNHQQMDENRGFLPPSMDTDSIADTIKSFFPLGAAAETQQQQPSAMQSGQFQAYSHPPDLLSRTSSHQSQDLRLSLHSFQDPMLLHHHHHEQPPPVAAVAFSGTSHLGFDTSPASSLWSEVARYQRMPAWNTATNADTGGGGSSGGAFVFGSQPILQPLFGQSQGQSQYFSMRGPLQSSSTPSVRAWIDPTITPDHHHIPHQPSIHNNSPTVSSLGFGSSGFLGYHIPARIRGQEEDHDDGTILNKPSSASSDSRH